MLVQSFKSLRISKPLVIAVILSTCSLPSFARDYKVEVLIFENLTPNRAYEAHTYSGPESMLSNAQTWEIEPTMLLTEANAINQSPDYQLLKHYSWGQESLPYSRSAAYQVIEPRINGWFKIYATQLLFANVDIDFNGYRMKEVRRLKLNEKHFFDHPKFGLLMQVSRLQEDTNAIDVNEAEVVEKIDAEAVE